MDDAFVLAVRRLKEGQAVEDSAQLVVQQFRPRLIAYFRHHNFSDADAEDLVQETFRRVVTGIRGLNDETKFMPWLFQIARNVRFTARTAVIERQEEALDMQEAAERADPVEDIASLTIRRQELEQAWNAVERLSPQQKQCLLLRVVQEMSYEEIATVLRISVSTVRNHLREARLNLRRILGVAATKGGIDGIDSEGL